MCNVLSFMTNSELLCVLFIKHNKYIVHCPPLALQTAVYVMCWCLNAVLITPLVLTLLSPSMLTKMLLKSLLNTLLSVYPISLIKLS